MIINENESPRKILSKREYIASKLLITLSEKINITDNENNPVYNDKLIDTCVRMTDTLLKRLEETK
jgi:hypothetical protein